jgi:Flp pilus assembly protein TadG
LASAFSRLLRQRSGNVALIGALVAPVVILAAGGILDLTSASSRQAALQQAADAAAVGAVARASPAYQAALAMNSDGAVSASNLQTNAQAIFNANLKNSGSMSTPTFTVSVNKTGSAVSSTVTTTSSYAPMFLGLIGQKSIALAATSHASDNIPAYMDFYMLLDNTPSMGLGATTTDIANMTQANGCAFACHTTNDPGEDYYTKAKSLGITMRIDVVRQATQQLMDTATSTETTNGIQNEFRVAIYDFGDYAYTAAALNKVSNLTPNLTSQSKQDAANVDLEQVPTNNYAYATPVAQGQVGNNDQDTSFDTLFPAIGAVMVPTGSAGGGGSPGSAQKILFVVTDGMVDQSNGGRQMGGINPATCTALKNKGIKIAILYTTYIPSSISNDSWSVSNALPLLPQIAPALQACASSGLYYEVSPSQGISQAMAALFQTVVASVRITS